MAASVPQRVGSSSTPPPVLQLSASQRPAFRYGPNAKEVEAKYRSLTCDKLYQWQQENVKGPAFVLHDGPPYANGDLAHGACAEQSAEGYDKSVSNCSWGSESSAFLFSELVRRKRADHRKATVPGWDCHGLPIENKTLKELKADATQLPPGEIRDAARKTALREVESQKAQFRTLGVMADWDSHDRTYRTLDHDYEMRQLRIFQRMVANGLIYRHYRPVHYSPSSLSALAEAELSYKDDHVSHSVFVTFDLDSASVSGSLLPVVSAVPKLQLLVWTTTPWTLTANMGIAVHSELTYTVVKTAEGAHYIVAQDRLAYVTEIVGEFEVLATIPGSDLVGAKYTPIFASLPSASTLPLTVVHSSHVTSDSGTGLVHCAPAHGPEDYHAFRALGLISDPDSILCHVGCAGEFIPKVAEVVGEEAAERLLKKPVLSDGSRACVDLLKEVGHLVKIKRIKHRYPYDWKTDQPIIVMATSQWFANLDSIKDNALNALADVSFFPPQSRNRLESFVRSRSEWCISRQRVWGVPIPALYEIESDKAILDSTTLDHILGVLQEKGVSYWWTGPIEGFLPPALLEQVKAKGVEAATVYRKGTDTMDVWFDSGSSWSMLPEMGVGKGTDASGTVRPFHADICLEGSDQHRGEEDEQVSGQHISPLTVINGGKNLKKEPAYGADILRLWSASVEYWRDMSLGPTVLSQTAETYRKIRNSARFALGNIDGIEGRPVVEKVPREQLGLLERYIMHELYNLEQTALDGYATHNFPKVVNALANFSNITLSSLYFDVTKDCLYADAEESFDRRKAVTVIHHILGTLTKVMAPILPHLAEEIHATLKNDASSVFMTPWTPLGAEWKDEEAARRMGHYLQMRSAALSLLEQARGAKQIRSSLEASVDIIIPDEAPVDNEFVSLITTEGADILKTLFIVSDATITSPGDLGISSPEWAYMSTIDIPGVTGSTKQYCKLRTLKEHDEYGQMRAERSRPRLATRVVPEVKKGRWTAKSYRRTAIRLVPMGVQISSKVTRSFSTSALVERLFFFPPLLNGVATAQHALLVQLAKKHSIAAGNARIGIARAIVRDLLPTDGRTLEDWGFRPAEACPERVPGPGPNCLFGLYVGLVNYCNIEPKMLDQWRRKGILLQEIKKVYEPIPEERRGGYYPWLLRNEYVLDLSQPVPSDTHASMAERCLKTAWAFAKGTPHLSADQIMTVGKSWGHKKYECLILCGTILEGARPGPDAFEEMWVHYGFCVGGLWEEMQPQGFARGDQEISKEFEDVMSGSGQGVYKSVWWLKAFVQRQVELVNPDFQMRPSVRVDYGFMNCRNEGERRMLLGLYRLYFDSETPAPRPLDLHQACIRGQLFEHLGTFPQVRLVEEHRRLLKNPYPLVIPEE
ncbi:tRNA synthetases class I-domain-containing protein [Coprinopsis sp. MPI-PUGE-AT-0042]|nr:tRNA synthetases class I-domain-containing protein [Coprinopsis sp. MPI-PUGE-AT-0042]